MEIAEKRGGEEDRFFQIPPGRKQERQFYNYLINKFCSLGIAKVQSGIFAAHMHVRLVNNGPVRPDTDIEPTCLICSGLLPSTERIQTASCSNSSGQIGSYSTRLIGAFVRLQLTNCVLCSSSSVVSMELLFDCILSNSSLFMMGCFFRYNVPRDAEFISQGSVECTVKCLSRRKRNLTVFFQPIKYFLCFSICGYSCS